MPDMLGLGLRPGPYPPGLGVHIGMGGEVWIEGKGRQWVEEKAERFVRQVAPYGFVRPMEASLQRAAEADPIKGETRHATTKAYSILWDGKDVTLVEASSMRKIENRSQTGRK
jgi:hypothetical protein